MAEENIESSISQMQVLEQNLRGIEMQKQNMQLQILESENSLKELKDYKLLFRFSNFFTDDNTSYNMAMLVNFAKMHYSKGNIEEGDKVLNIIIQNLFKEKVKENQFPLYVVNLIIFTLLHKGLNDLVIKIVKYKKIYEVLNELKLIKNNK